MASWMTVLDTKRIPFGPIHSVRSSVLSAYWVPDTPTFVPNFKKNGNGSSSASESWSVVVFATQGPPGTCRGCTYVPVVHITPSELGVVILFLVRTRRYRKR